MRHRRVAIDTNVLVYLLEDSGPLAGKAATLVDAIESGRFSAVFAAIGLAELASGPARAGDLALAERYAEELQSVDSLMIIPLTADVALDAAVICGHRRIGLVDAIHLATARGAGATAFVTNDRALRGSKHLSMIYLDDLEADPAAAEQPAG